MENVKYIGKKSDRDIFISIYILGVLVAYLHNKIDSNNIQQMLIRPGMIEYFEKIKIDKSIIDMMWSASELEDVESLFPEKIEDEIKLLIDKLIVRIGNYNLSDTIKIIFE